MRAADSSTDAIKWISVVLDYTSNEFRLFIARRVNCSAFLLEPAYIVSFAVETPLCLDLVWVTQERGVVSQALANVAKGGRL